MYHLNEEFTASGYGKVRRCMFASDDLSAVKKRLGDCILTGGFPIRKLSITKEIDFEVECEVKLDETSKDL